MRSKAEGSQVSTLEKEAFTYAAMNGLLMLAASDEPGLIHVPVSLLPAMAVPKTLFEEVRSHDRQADVLA